MLARALASTSHSLVIPPSSALPLTASNTATVPDLVSYCEEHVDLRHAGGCDDTGALHECCVGVRTRGSGFGFYRVVRRMNEQSTRQHAESSVRRSAMLPFSFLSTSDLFSGRGLKCFPVRVPFLTTQSLRLCLFLALFQILLSTSSLSHSLSLPFTLSLSHSLCLFVFLSTDDGSGEVTVRKRGHASLHHPPPSESDSSANRGDSQERSFTYIHTHIHTYTDI